MKPRPVQTNRQREQPAQPVSQRRVWRVFEYRRPVPARRLRFTV